MAGLAGPLTGGHIWALSRECFMLPTPLGTALAQQPLPPGRLAWRGACQVGGGLSGGFFFSPTQARAAVSPQKRKSDGKNHRGSSTCHHLRQLGLQERNPERSGGHVGSAARESLGGRALWEFGEQEPGSG